MAESFRRLAPLPQLALRGDAADAAFAGAVRGTLGVAVPTEPNTVATAGGVAALWLGPDEWLVVGAPPDCAERLRRAWGDAHAAAVDVSDSRIVFELSGPRALDLLAKGCSLDLHERAFPAGRCAQTALARAAVILEKLDAGPRFRVFVRRSFAGYLAAWLAEAAATP
jgi:sarcosine oxidase subunit gamma